MEVSADVGYDWFAQVTEVRAAPRPASGVSPIMDGLISSLDRKARPQKSLEKVFSASTGVGGHAPETL
jgi:hypothetical protein